MEEEKLNNLIYLLRIHHIDSEPLENLIKGYKELEVDNLEKEIWKNKYIEQVKYGNKVTLDGDAVPHIMDLLKKDYIPKSKVREKIEELEKEIENINNKNDGYWEDTSIMLDEQKSILEELLQEGDK